TNREWQLIMSPQQFYVMRRAGTERPSLSGNALDHRNGTYVCSACGNPLYTAETKFNSGTGWPSFWQPICKEAVHGSSSPFSVISAIIEKREALSPERALLVTISGIDASGKGFVAARIAESLKKGGIKPAVINVDGWLNLPHVRFHRRNPARHFYENAIRFD